MKLCAAPPLIPRGELAAMAWMGKIRPSGVRRRGRQMKRPQIISCSTSQRDLAFPDAHYLWPLAPSRTSPQTFAIALRHQRFPNGGGQHPRCMVLFSSNRGEGIAWSPSKYGTAGRLGGRNGPLEAARTHPLRSPASCFGKRCALANDPA